MSDKLPGRPTWLRPETALALRTARRLLRADLDEVKVHISSSLHLNTFIVISVGALNRMMEVINTYDEQGGDDSYVPEELT